MTEYEHNTSPMATGERPFAAAAALSTLPRADDPILSRMVITGCSRRKRHTDTAVPALDLYEGGCVPPLRERIGHRTRLRARIRILSARHGFVTADTPLLPYEQSLDPVAAARLRSTVAAALLSDYAITGLPDEVLVIAEPLYMVAFTDLLTTRCRVRWVSDVHGGWSQASAVLDEWGWP